MKPATLLVALAFLSLTEAVSAQAFVVDAAAIPSGPGVNGSTENIDWGDLDLDGDWDVVIADGGDDGNIQNKIWINQGQLQAGVEGFFLDETAARAPAVADQSRDIELADIDGDGDLDVASANTAQLVNQSSRLWVNQGLLQGGAVGFFTDETSTRWVGLGGAGSSIAPALVLPSGGFIDWCDDIDFGDLDNDGDLDLVHSSAGGGYSGLAPARIFLNDGLGFFTEHNPSGFQLSTSSIVNGDPGLWCEGTQQSNTLDASGAFCDVASTTRDFDIGDLDGDFDLDLVVDHQNALARVFANRLDASGLAPASAGLLFRDVTGASWGPVSAVGSISWDVEIGDLDGDGDLDVYGVDWFQPGFSAFDDVLIENLGDGTFASSVIVPGAGPDGGEADFFDYDGDGDMDIFLTQYGAFDILFRNDGGGFGNITSVPIEMYFASSLDADAADVDGDGDLDLLVAEDNFQANTFLRNVVDVPDTHAPYLPRVESAGAPIAAPSLLPVRVQVYDNAPYYLTWYADVVLEVEVDGVALPPLAATSSGGQIFRAELPGNLVGAVEYRFTATDRRGNLGASSDVAFSATTGLAFAADYGVASAGTTTGTAPTISALSVPFLGSTLYLAVHSDAPPGTTVFAVASAVQADPPLPLPGLVLSNVGLPLLWVESAVTDAAGDVVFELPIPPGTPGTSVYFQGAALDPTPAGELLSASRGLELITQ
ncbi:MAG: FG-GAP-like repeat-containing protein [Planctomycetota bacterium]